MLHTFANVQLGWWSEPGNNACWVRERKIGLMKRIPTNRKNYAKTMTDAEVMREVVVDFQMSYRAPPEFEEEMKLSSEVGAHVKSKDKAFALMDAAEEDADLKCALDETGGLLMGALNGAKTMNSIKNADHGRMLDDALRRWPGARVEMKFHETGRGEAIVVWNRYKLMNNPFLSAMLFPSKHVLNVGDDVFIDTGKLHPDGHPQAGKPITYYGKIKGFYKLEVEDEQSHP